MEIDLFLKYFEEIKERTNGDNSSNSEIIDYENGDPIDIYDVASEYYSYLNLQQEISDYIEKNYLDDVSDKNQIKKHFNQVDGDLFKFSRAALKDFVSYMVIKINKKNANHRKTNVIFGKDGNGYTTTRITLPVDWVREIGFTEYAREAIIVLEDDEIKIRRDLN